MNFIRTKILIVALGATTVACGSSKTSAILNDINSPVASSEFTTKEALEKEFQVAKDARLDVMAPTLMGKAQREFEKGLRSSSGDESAKAFSNAHALILQAEEDAKPVKEKMLPVIEAREKAIQLRAHEWEREKFADLEQAFARTIRDIEGSSRPERRDAIAYLPTLQKEFTDVAISSSQKQSMGGALSVFEMARKEGAEKRVPATYRETQRLINDTTDFVRQTYTNPEKARLRGLNSQKQAEKLLRVNRQVKSWENLNKEQIALKVEDQVAELNSKFSNMASQSEHLSNQLAATQAEFNKLKAEAIKGQKLGARDERFNSLSKIFDPQEAEVNRKDTSVTVRLKKVKFPVGKSEIPTQSFSLLKKLIQAIDQYPNAIILIEGHTDSTGNPVTNRALSEERANAVRAFLLSNGQLSADQVLAKGFGSEQPLASNETKEGRAMNRRIDVVIQPQQ